MHIGQNIKIPRILGGFRDYIKKTKQQEKMWEPLFCKECEISYIR